MVNESTRKRRQVCLSALWINDYRGETDDINNPRLDVNEVRMPPRRMAIGPVAVDAQPERCRDHRPACAGTFGLASRPRPEHADADTRRRGVGRPHNGAMDQRHSSRGPTTGLMGSDAWMAVGRHPPAGAMTLLVEFLAVASWPWRGPLSGQL
jgi:hypothetical protein